MNDGLPTLVCTVGLPRSGKTTWARKQRAPIVCPDAIRLALHGQRFVALAEPFVWAIAKVMVRSLFRAGHQVVVLDACNVSRNRRGEWLDPEWRTRFALIGTPPVVCVRRADETNDTVIVPVIKRMAEEWEDLGEDELEWQAEARAAVP